MQLFVSPESFPKDYSEFHALGLMSPGRDQLKLSRFSWLSYEEVVAFRYPIARLAWTTPFAKAPNGDTFAWYGDSQHIAYLPRDEAVGTLISSSFRDFVYWAILDELRESWLHVQLNMTSDDVCIRLNDYVNRLKSYLLPEFCIRLETYAARLPTLDKWQNLKFMSNEEFENETWPILALPPNLRTFRQF